MVALYHKHRPQKFESVVGQEHIIKTITNQIIRERISHAYLFSGPRGVGKTTTARLLSKAVNCTNREGNTPEPCDTCESCKEISGSRSIDVIEIDAASHTGVDNVRENIIENAQFRPTKQKYKVFIIDEVHMLSTSAFNALLKILEEPPEHIIFILATTELHKLPETIISRCQRFDFKKVPYDEMKKQIEKITKEEGVEIDKDVIDRIINKSDSCVRDAISLLDQVMATGEKKITNEIASVVLPSSNVDETINFITNLIKKDAKKSLEQINEIAEAGIDLIQFANDIVEILRVTIVKKVSAKTQSSGIDLNKVAEKSITNLSKEINNQELVRLIDLISERRGEIKSTPIPQLPLELAIIEWCEDKNTIETKPVSTSDEVAPDKPISIDVAPKKEIKEDTEIAEPEKKTEESISHKSSLTIDDVKNKWDEFLHQIEKESTSLSFILKSSSVDSVHNGSVIISVAFSLHKDKLIENNSRKKIQEVMSSVLGQSAEIDIIVKESAQTDKIEIDNELQDLTAAFGGEIIN